jgi:hypothetical protein
MKSTILLLSIATLAGASVAQQAAVDRNNGNWVVISGTKHPTTQRAYNWPPVSPAQYVWTSGQTVPAGTLTARWIPSMTNLRREQRTVSGFLCGLYPSAASSSFPQNGYFPAMRVHVPRQTQGQAGQTWAQGAQFQPDMTQQPLHMQAQGTFNFTQFGAFLVTQTLMTPVTINQTEMVISAEWRGGENDSIAGQQSINGDYSAGIHNTVPTTTFFVAPGPAFTITPYTDGFQGFSMMWLQYLEDQPVINAQSDWGYRRDPALNPVTGYNAATALSDISGVTGNLGWDCDAGQTHAGEICALLFNVGNVFPIGVPFLGVTLELNPADPSFGLLAPVYNKILDATGQGDLPMLPLPALGAGAIGLSFGGEFILLNSTFTQVTGSTQSTWVTINR